MTAFRVSVVVIAATALTACTTGGLPSDAAPAPVDSGAPPTDAGHDAGSPDPFEGACVRAKAEAELEPGTLLLAIDQSVSMSQTEHDQAPGEGQPSRWEQMRTALVEWLDVVPDELGLGLLLFPTEAGTCGVSTTPTVAPALARDVRDAIRDALDRTPIAVNSPFESGLSRAYDVLASLPDTERRALLFFTDGIDSCRADNVGTILDATAKAAADGVRTFVFGLPGAPHDILAAMARNGETPRMADCIVPTCYQHRCPPDRGDYAYYCHYARDMAIGLAVASRDFTQSCVYRMPELAPRIDPFLVNVSTRAPGAERRLVRYSDRVEETISSWRFFDARRQTIEIRGSLCEDLRNEHQVVEISYGCERRSRE